MTFNEFKEELIEALEKKNIPPKEIVEKYEKRMQLALEAGFSEEEAINKFGSIDDIVESCLKSDEKDECLKTFSVSIDSGDIIVKFVEGSDISYSLPEKYLKDYNVKNNSDGFSFEPVSAKMPSHRGITFRFFIGKELKFAKFIIRSATADIIIKSGDIKADVCKFEIVSGDLNIEGIEAKKEFAISTISGDVEVDKIKSDKVSISTVSGDLEFKSAVIETLDVSTISGDINVNGLVSNIKSSAISGEVTYNAEEVSKPFTKKVINIFRRNKNE